MTAARLRAVIAAFLAGFAGTVVLGPVAGQTPDSSGTPTPGPNPTGRPKQFEAGKGAMVAIWHDDHWHLALTTTKKGKGDLFTGSVRADKGQVIGAFDKLEKRKDGKVDWIFPHKDGGGFDFRFTNFGFVDKTQFKATGATTLTFNVQLNGQPAPQIVYVGKAGKHPEKVPFTLPANP
ncbi:hypothetical protein J0H58_02660 [bacterium]|nr:hypothetical protein [bacterium]